MTNSHGWAKKNDEAFYYQIGETVAATIVDIERVPGNWGDQFQFSLLLEEGFRTYAWVPAKETDCHTSQLGRTVMTTLDETHTTLEETIQALKAYGTVYVKCVGYNDRNGRALPKFKIDLTRLPKKKPRETKLNE